MLLEASLNANEATAIFKVEEGSVFHVTAWGTWGDDLTMQISDTNEANDMRTFRANNTDVTMSADDCLRLNLPGPFYYRFLMGSTGTSNVKIWVTPALA
jgi:hypothetical protein